MPLLPHNGDGNWTKRDPFNDKGTEFLKGLKHSKQKNPPRKTRPTLCTAEAWHCHQDSEGTKTETSLSSHEGLLPHSEMAMTSVQSCFPNLASLEASTILGSMNSAIFGGLSLARPQCTHSSLEQQDGAMVYLDLDVVNGVCPSLPANTHTVADTAHPNNLVSKTKLQRLAFSHCKFPLNNFNCL